MWLAYVGIAVFFIFLSQLSGLPQAMFYHLHWAVALPMAFLGFLVLIPGLIREVVHFLIWPFLRPFVQLLVEAVGFVSLTSEEDSQDGRDSSMSSAVPTSSIQTILRVCRLSVVLRPTVRLAVPPPAPHIHPRIDPHAVPPTIRHIDPRDSRRNHRHSLPSNRRQLGPDRTHRRRHAITTRG